MALFYFVDIPFFAHYFSFTQKKRVFFMRHNAQKTKKKRTFAIAKSGPNGSENLFYQL